MSSLPAKPAQQAQSFALSAHAGRTPALRTEASLDPISLGKRDFVEMSIGRSLRSLSNDGCQQPFQELHDA
jgi:hypothetical protein